LRPVQLRAGKHAGQPGSPATYLPPPATPSPEGSVP
jgi:hypothetical protein